MSRPPNYEFQEWWNKHREEDDLLLDKSLQTRNHLTVEIPPCPTADPTVDKDRTRTARQLSWLYLLKFHHYLAYPTKAFFSILGTAKRRLTSPDSPVFLHSPRYESRLYRLIKVFLIIIVLLLVLELLAYFKGWHFSPPSVDSSDIKDFVEYFYANWLEIRANYLAPPLQGLTNLCVVLFLVQSVDRLVLVLGCFWIKFRGIKPVAEMDYEDDLMKVEDYPMVLVQIPMCNEREVRRCVFPIPILHSLWLNCEYQGISSK